ncbi:hypothetical protein OG978_39310 [Streptomyces sp. NBC_01591]|nr:hypothetical protein [Streptomyces sp. NBC_01591]WSD72900.1 hypothetical protein OG978_39310 [Streptomyces sp. NBC_01591]
MSQETPIYNRLVAEQGDVPAAVRGEAQRIERDLERVIPPNYHPVTAGLAQRGDIFRPGI